MVAFLLGPALALAQTDKIAALNKAFGMNLKDGKTMDARWAAVDAIKGEDTPQVAEAYASAYLKLENECAPIEKQRWTNIKKADPKEVAPLRAELDPLRQLQGALIAAVREFKNPTTLLWLVDHVVSDEKIPFNFKVAAVRAASKSEGTANGLVAAMNKAQKAEEIAVLLEAMAALGTKAAAAGDAVVEQLEHADVTIREKAAWALASMAVPQAIEPLIGRLSQENGRALRRMASALEILTREKLGTALDAWKSWFSDKGASYVSGAVPLGGGKPSEGPDILSGYFHGIPQVGHSIVYVVDVSGSMKASMTNPRYNGPVPDPAPAGEESRMEASKKELVKALKELPKGTMFNIVYYSFVAQLYSPKMVEANDAKIKDAIKFVEGLAAEGATNIYEAMEVAFSLAGRGTIDRYYDLKVETVFLLTDGEPQLPNGVEDSTDRIIEGVRMWNPLKKVVVHSIAMGKDTNDLFLRQLASENSGQFAQR